MPRNVKTPDRLFDRPWQPMHPFHPRLSALRRWGMFSFFILLTLLITAYWYYTDSERVRSLAESYLTRLLGGPVHVKGAALSIFEGLRLDGVEVRVDGQDTPDAIIFTAKTFQLQYDPTAMLRGELLATQIRAIDPRVHLTENRDTGRWNYQRMIRRQSAPSTTSTEPARVMLLPEILLRNAQIDYSEIRGGQLYQLGSMAIEGRLTPSAESGRYAFDLQSRGQSDGVGPVISGSIVMDSGFVSARMLNFKFGRDIRTMLPAQVRDWWDQHGLSGRVNIPELSYTPPRAGKPAKFRVVTELRSVTLAMQPEEFRSDEENQKLAAASTLFNALRTANRGFAGPDAANRGKPMSSHEMAAVSDGFERWASTFENIPIVLRDVSGAFIFTEEGIEIDEDREVTGRVENNVIHLAGHIDGYSPAAPAHLTVASGINEHIVLPPALSYANSLPLPVREMYERLRPEGTCDLKFELIRKERGGKVEVIGGVNILDGRFVFDRFPYPLRGATGRVEVGRDEHTGIEYLAIKDLKGWGIQDGLNAESIVKVNGLIAPLGPDAGVTIRVEGSQIHSEPAMTAAFPRDVRRSLAFLDAENKGGPVFVGNFVCDILRPIGFKQSWTVNTDIELLDASGSMTVFPYPLRNVTGLLKLREGYIDIINATSRHQDSTLAIDGRISWGNPDEDDDRERVASELSPQRPKSKVRPDVKVVARNVPIDKTLLDALPPERRAWLEKMGLSGTLDIDGRITEAGIAGMPPALADDDTTFDLSLKLREGSIWPAQGTFAISKLNGLLRLSPTRLEIIELQGERDASALTASGLIDWPTGEPQFKLSATAKQLALDSPLYQMLPKEAKEAWDAVNPQGTVDLDLSWEGKSDGSKPTIAMVLRPQQLSVKPNVFPYRLDDVRGEVRYADDRVTLDALTATHDKTTVQLAGTGAVGNDPAWSLKLSANRVNLDAELLSALPDALSEMFKSMEFKGETDVTFSKLTYKPSTPGINAPVGTQPADAESDIDFDCVLSMADASLDAGMPMQKVTGSIGLKGAVRASSLDWLDGAIKISSMTMADRPVSDFSAHLVKESGMPTLRLENMQASLASGDLAGQLEFTVPDATTSSRYAINIVLRNADVRQLAGESGADVEGRINASLALAGSWDDPSSRRGRGEVVAAGKQMYRIPLMLGLLQITNLTLPINKPFNEASSRYSVEGQRVIFEQIRLTSENMQMQGSGTLDFGTKKVNLTFFTDSSNWAKIPIVGDLLKGAREELLQFHVRGTLEEPKVSATSMRTLQTTIDEVFREPK